MQIMLSAGASDLASAAVIPSVRLEKSIPLPSGRDRTNALCVPARMGRLTLRAYCRDVMMRASAQTREGPRTEIRLPSLTKLVALKGRCTCWSTI